jgi:hypothetical protein
MNDLQVINLSCPNCGARLVLQPSAPLGVQTRCQFCSREVALPEPVRQPAALPASSPVSPPAGLPDDAPGFRPRKPVLAPHEVILREDAYGFRIECSWQGPRAVVYLACLLMFALLYWAQFPVDGAGLQILRLLQFGVPALALLYLTLLEYVNRSTITVTWNTLTVTHGPLPNFKQGLTVIVPKIEQLYSKPHVESFGQGAESGEDLKLVFYDLVAILTGGEQVTLLHGLPRAQVCLYLEQQIEKRLRIIDQPVEGELRR